MPHAGWRARFLALSHPKHPRQPQWDRWNV